MGPIGPVIPIDSSFRRSAFRVRFHFVPLFLDDASQLALHGLERVVDHFGERRVGAVVHSLFVGDQFVPGRNGDVDPDPERISFLMGVVRLLDGNVAAVDVVAEFLEARRLIHDELINVVGFHDAFKTMERELRRVVEKQRHEVKTHASERSPK